MATLDFPVSQSVCNCMSLPRGAEAHDTAIELDNNTLIRRTR